MKNKEKLNEVMVVLDEIKQISGDKEALELYTTILESIERDISELQERVVARVENIL